ncbi:MAG TPA: hypothetical protein EYQ54_03545 [Myxococcales bacterium]|nr:hypothetical protein [Myxococcales bacterium]
MLFATANQLPVLEAHGGNLCVIAARGPHLPGATAPLSSHAVEFPSGLPEHFFDRLLLLGKTGETSAPLPGAQALALLLASLPA